MKTLVSQFCNTCGRNFHTPLIRGSWKRVDAAVYELVLEKFPCGFCGGGDVGAPIFDNGGMLIIEDGE
jgi:hypothetical protein